MNGEKNMVSDGVVNGSKCFKKWGDHYDHSINGFNIDE